MATVNVFKFAKNGETFPAGTTLFRQGETGGDKMYVVQEGEVEVYVGETLKETLGQGGVVGEMALIDDSPRSATVVVKTNATLVPLTVDDFLTHVHSTPFFSLQVMRVIVHRLRKEMYGDDGAGPA